MYKLKLISMGFIDLLLGRTDNDVDTVFTNKKGAVNAMEAYQKSRYGIVKNDKQLLEEFFTDVRELIEIKNEEHRYCGMVEVSKDIIQFLPKIEETLVKENGYKVIVIDDNSVINNTQTNVTSTLATDSTFLLIFWDKQSIEEIARTNSAKVKSDESPSVPVTSGNSNNVNKTSLNS